ncbi:alkaline phosphatase family protein [Isosphaeraceae bacterium EP7]
MHRRLALAALALALVMPSTARAEDRHVVVITLDGFPATLLDDPHVSLPNLRKLRAEGASSRQGMRVVNPSVTWPNHTSLMTGVYPDRHGVLFNGVATRGEPGSPTLVDPARSQQDLVKIPLLFDVLKDAGMDSAALFWPCTRGSKSIADNMPDVPKDLDFTTPRLKQELADKGLLVNYEKGGGVVRDEVWTEAACQILRARKPRLLALHLLNLDGTHHRHGPDSAPGYTAASLLDRLVGQVVGALEEAGIRKQTTLFVLSDHGFIAVTKNIRPNIALRDAGLLVADEAKIKSAKAHVISEGGIGMVYLTDPSTAAQDRDAVTSLFRDAEGIAAVLQPADYPEYHFPQPAENRSMADLVLVAKDGYGFSATAKGAGLIEANATPTGSHGYVSTEPKMNALFLVNGAGVKAGALVDRVNTVDIAPTAAHLLGVSLGRPDGRVLSELFEAGN